MSWTTKIRYWAEWTAARLKEANDLPPPRYWRNDVPWFEDFVDLGGEDGAPKELHEAFEEVIADDSFTGRFVGLELYDRLAHQDSYPLRDELVDEARQMAADEYRWLIEAVPASGVPAQRRRLDWEIRLAGPVRMWERADALLERLREVGVDSRELDAIRAQHVFLRRYLPADTGTFDDALMADVLWPPRRVLKAASAEFFGFRDHALQLTRPVSEVDGPSSEEVFSAVGGAHWPEVPSLKALLLARPAFELGLSDVTIANLNVVLDSTPGALKGPVYNALWNAHQQNGDSGATKGLLERWSLEFPDNSSVLMRLAKVAADDADYENAYRFLQRAVTAKPELEQELATRVGLALGEIATEKALTWNEVKAALSRHPAVERVVDTVLRAYWPSFAALEPQEQVEWLTAMYAVHVVADQAPMLAPGFVRHAGVTFITISEAVLRRTAFAPMRTDVAADPPLLQRLRSMRDPKDPNHILAKYLAAPKGVVTLGQMLRILERAGSQSFPEPFVALVSKHLATSPVLEQLDAARRLDQHRNPAVHELATVNALSIHDDARHVIDAALRHASCVVR